MRKIAMPRIAFHFLIDNIFYKIFKSFYFFNQRGGVQFKYFLRFK